jgi:hypothetical protein
MQLYTAILRVRTTLASRGGPRRKSIRIKIVLTGSSEADATAKASHWFERERQQPTAKFMFGSGRMDSLGVELDRTAGDAIQVFEHDDSVMVIS